MCEYLQLNQKGLCSITQSQCPYVYYCSRHNRYRPQSVFPKNCKVAEQVTIPEGYYKVALCRHGNLYVDYNGHIEIVKNPFDEVPKYVKLTKQKNGNWRVRK